MKSIFQFIIGSIFIFQIHCSSQLDKNKIEDLKYSINTKFDYTNSEIITAFNQKANQEYKIGPGDKMELIVPGVDSLSKEYTVSPDGSITIHPVGEIKVENQTRTEAETSIKNKLKQAYILQSLTLRILAFENNKIGILGNVEKPGLISFERRPTLLEVIAKTGVTFGKERNKNSRCAIFRDKETVLWIDLSELLVGGNTSLNVNLTNRDVVYFPGADEFNVYVLGEINNPGAYSLGSSMNIIKAISYAGGNTEHALLTEVKLIRKKQSDRDGGELTFDLENLIDNADFKYNYALKPEDIIYVPRRGVSKFNYYLRMLNPFAQLFIVGSAVKTTTSQ